jgi:hypothetical protein
MSVLLHLAFAFSVGKEAVQKDLGLISGKAENSGTPATCGEFPHVLNACIKLPRSGLFWLPRFLLKRAGAVAPHMSRQIVSSALSKNTITQF